MKPLQLLFGFAIVPRVLYGMLLGVRVVGFESDINPYLLASRNMFDHTLCFDSELHIIAISTMHDTYSLDLLCREVCNPLLGIANQPQTSNATSIGEGDMFPIRLQ